MFEELSGLFYTEFQDGVAAAIGGEAIFAVFPLQEGEMSLVHRFHQRVEARLRVNCSLGYTIIRGREQLATGYAASRQVIQKRFFRGIGRVFELDGSRSKETAAEQAKSKYSGANMAEVIEVKMKQWRGEIKSAERVKMEASQIMSSFMYTQGSTAALPELIERIRQMETLDQLEELLMTVLADLGKLNPGATWTLIEKAVDYMKQRYKEEIHLQEVADHVHLSRSYFSILFKKHTGSSFIDYIHELRITEAKRLLLQNEYKIYEVAEESGFNDVKYFSRLFKKMTGQTPQEYREQQPSGRESGSQ
ncbi:MULTISPECIES: helix-turn-helix transcriptional regulator [Paenibacillus]|uniref:helix-turn-helix transcriptional regulator n=1 Tax=Paenibacillus TaxID=44249 RepID=UPI0022B88912|nr:AraC family transcriptional regulator [Paenibacillus caseinilyticus]MCZ8518300.1 AraC family transcriptional regulator [Paenibacillus caseinilyticus]